MAQIRFGLKKRLDVSIYAKAKYNDLQMGQIRKGLENNLDVSQYAKTEIFWKEMEKIRLKLLKESTLK